MVCCRWNKKQFAASDGGERERIAKPVNIFLGCFFLLNYFLGNGYLSYPYSFLYAGYLAAIPTLLLITFTSTITGARGHGKGAGGSMCITNSTWIFFLATVATECEGVYVTLLSMAEIGAI